MKIKDLQSIIDDVYKANDATETAGETQLSGEPLGEEVLNTDDGVNTLIQHIREEYCQYKTMIENDNNSYTKFSYDTIVEANKPINKQAGTMWFNKNESDYIKFRLEQLLDERNPELPWG